MALSKILPASQDQFAGARNLIINGACVIDQRNAGASVTPNLLAYPVDRIFGFGSVTGKFSCQQNSGSVTPPVGFSNYIGAVSLSAYSVGSAEQYIFGQPIEGLNVTHLEWGTSSAATVTLSFYVRSSLTGTFGGALQNSAFDRSYPFSYTISTANTWERKTITIVGDTSGTWLKTNGVGIRVGFSLGAGSSVSGTAGAWASGNFVSATGATSVVGTNAATLYITGVQLELGDTATPFATGRVINVSDPLCAITFPTAMRLTPSVTSSNTAAWYNNAGSIIGVVNPSVHYSSGENNINTIDVKFQASGTLASNNSPMMYAFNPAGYIDFDSEL